MADSTLHRASHDLEVRGDGRTVYGILMPFGQEAEVNDGYGPYVESFRRGAFTKTIRERAGRVKLCLNHDKYNRFPVGRDTTLREDPAGLYGEFRLSSTRDAEEALTLVRDGVVDSFSVGFLPVKERTIRPAVIERTEVALLETSLVAFPAYQGAAIAGVRSTVDVDEDDLREWFGSLRIDDMAVRAALRRLRDDFARQMIIDTPDLGAVTPTPDDGDGSEPTEPVTRDDEPPEPDEVEHSSHPYQPTPRPAYTTDRRRADIDAVRRAYLPRSA